MKYFKISKHCPFCPTRDHEYIYRTYSGLYRHVLRWHALIEPGRWWKDFDDEPITLIRVYIVKFSKFKDVKVNGLAHLEALLERYAKGTMNPSLRENETLDELLGEKNEK